MVNSGKQFEEISDRQKWMKLSKFKESATKALWFVETFGVNHHKKWSVLATRWWFLWALNKGTVNLWHHHQPLQLTGTATPMLCKLWPLQCYANFVSAGAVWSQWWILPRVDTSKINVVGCRAGYLLVFSPLCIGVPWGSPKLPSQASLAGNWERHWAWTGTCSILWCVSPLQASYGGCTATWGTSCTHIKITTVVVM